jgi:hypothetical protein
MKKIKCILFIVLALASGLSQAYIDCRDVPVTDINGADGASFHNFSEVGLTGSILYFPVPASKCTNSTGAPLSTSLFLVIDDLDSGEQIKKIWTSILLSANARSQSISFHAHDLGNNSRGFQVMTPYWIGSN